MQKGIKKGQHFLKVTRTRHLCICPNKEDYLEVDIQIPPEDDLLVKKACLLSKSVPRQSNRAKWREKSGYNPNMLSDCSSAGVL